MTPRLLKVSEAAHRLRIAERTVRKYADEGRLPVAVRLATGERLFRAADIDAIADAGIHHRDR